MAMTGGKAVVWKVMGTILAAVGIAPLLGFTGGFVSMVGIYWLFHHVAPHKMRRVFGRLQYLTTAFMAYSHGKNDGQMPIGVITMALVLFYNDTSLWDRLALFNSQMWWVIVISALAISFGTALGGRQVIKTLGMRIANLRPVHGFAASGSAATVIEIASNFGIPVSTTHCISASVTGAGAITRFSAVRWRVAGNIIVAWILTFPICGALGYAFAWLLKTII